MKRSEFLEKEYNKFFSHVEELDNTKDRQILRFLEWCFEKGFLDNIEEKDLEYFYEENERLDLPFLTNHKITIGIEEWPSGTVRVGIDPTACFNKTKDSSIYVKFPMTKRYEKTFYKTLEAILDKKSNISKNFFKVAGSSWCGELLTNI